MSKLRNLCSGGDTRGPHFTSCLYFCLISHIPYKSVFATCVPASFTGCWQNSFQGQNGCWLLLMKLKNLYFVHYVTKNLILRRCSTPRGPKELILKEFLPSLTSEFKLSWSMWSSHSNWVRSWLIICLDYCMQFLSQWESSFLWRWLECKKCSLVYLSNLLNYISV